MRGSPRPGACDARPGGGQLPGGCIVICDQPTLFPALSDDAEDAIQTTTPTPANVPTAAPIIVPIPGKIAVPAAAPISAPAGIESRLIGSMDMEGRLSAYVYLLTPASKPRGFWLAAVLQWEGRI